MSKPRVLYGLARRITIHARITGIFRRMVFALTTANTATLQERRALNFLQLSKCFSMSNRSSDRSAKQPAG